MFELNCIYNKKIIKFAKVLQKINIDWRMNKNGQRNFKINNKGK